MGTIVVVVLLALVLATAVIVYAAYPYRGETTPVSPRIGEVMSRGVSSLPTIDVAHAEESAREHAASRR
ncbi:hypothetical protein ASG49_12010 [Marmoricola sp. Leaf446]|uniref:hypothetical protein n=1 Tax=Marmoricola sp. Leaf446 TaxID=1736379 RepID=UPI0006F656AE|nr:hypothetical protein [Marmoricola sp. Leaf446]KQT91065.1 hypothetical protein ASG49_12010 [Marmoricola sp. Leaf446]